MDRTGCIGATDFAHIMARKPYGCPRKCWFETTGAEPDFPFEGNGQTLRGQVLESYILERYEAMTGHKVTAYNPDRFRAPDAPDWLKAHPDGIALDEYRQPIAAVEAKSCSPDTWERFTRFGIPQGYILQGQAHLIETGLAVCYFPILHCEDFDKFEVLKIERRPALVEKMLAAGSAFWQAVVDATLPDKPTKYEPRCGNCAYRVTCLGPERAAAVEALPPRDPDKPEVTDGEHVELAAALEPLLEKYDKFSDVQGRAKEQADMLREKIAGLLEEAGLQACRLHGRSISNYPSEGRSFDRKQYEADHEIDGKYFTVTAKRTLRIGPVKRKD